MSFYLIDDLEQGTAKWLQWRRGVIGASEAAIIMGENRWKVVTKDEVVGLIDTFSGLHYFKADEVEDLNWPN
jgi:predicted phage-related endonuclease